MLLESTNDEAMEKMVMGFSIKWFIILIWCIPWSIFMGIFLDFSTFYWGLMEYFYVILLVFILTSRDYMFLSLTFLSTGVYYIYSLKERWIINTAFGFYKSMVWGILNIMFAFFVIVCWNIKKYPNATKHIKKKHLPWNFYWKVVYVGSIMTGILCVVCCVLLGIAYAASQPKSIKSNYYIEFSNKSFDKVVRAELDIDDDAKIKRSDLDDIVGISVTNSMKVTFIREYTYDTSKWDENSLMYDFNSLIDAKGTEYNLTKPVKDLKDIRNFRKLKYLEIVSDNNLKIYHVDDLRWLKNLETLKLTTGINNKEETSLAALSDLTSLKCLSLSLKKIASLNSVKGLKNLTTLEVQSESEINDISGISKLKKLEYVYLCNLGIDNIDSMKELENVKYLAMMKNNITDISALSKCKKMQYIDMRYNNITDLSVMQNMPELKYVVLLDNKNIREISVLGTLKNLKYLWINENKNYSLNIFGDGVAIYTGIGESDDSEDEVQNVEMEEDAQAKQSN